MQCTTALPLGFDAKSYQVLNLEAGDLVRFEPYEMGSTDLFIEDRLIMTDLPAPLRFPHSGRFEFRARAQGPELDVKISAASQFSNQGHEGLELRVTDQENPREIRAGLAQLEKCLRPEYVGPLNEAWPCRAAVNARRGRLLRSTLEARLPSCRP